MEAVPAPPGADIDGDHAKPAMPSGKAFRHPGAAVA